MLERGVVAPDGIHAYLQRAQPPVFHEPQRPEHVPVLRLDHEQKRRVTDACVRARQQEQIRKTGNRGSLIRGHPSIRPGGGEAGARAAPDSLEDGVIGDAETGRQDQCVKFALVAIDGDD